MFIAPCSTHSFRTFLHRPHLRRKKIQLSKESSKNISLDRQRLLPRRVSMYKSPRSSGSGSLSLSNYSSPDELSSEETMERVEACRDICYFELPYSFKRYLL